MNLIARMKAAYIRTCERIEAQADRYRDERLALKAKRLEDEQVLISVERKEHAEFVAKTERLKLAAQDDLKETDRIIAKADKLLEQDK